MIGATHRGERSMMSVTVGRLPDGVMAVLVVLGVGSAFLVSGSRARADTIVRGGLTPQGMAVDGSGDVFIADTYHHGVLVEKPNGLGGYTHRVVDAGLHSAYGVAVDGSGDLFIADEEGHGSVVEHAAGVRDGGVLQRPGRGVVDGRVHRHVVRRQVRRRSPGGRGTSGTQPRLERRTPATLTGRRGPTWCR